jgi:glycosyltransferase involved in cell wall biosynthesis
MAGKFEARKMHIEILQAFAKLYAGNPAVSLRCCISNRFIDMRGVYEMIHQRIFQGVVPPNIEFLDWLPTEKHFADFLCAGDCLISPSRGESFNLPLLQALACGKQVITNKAHAHADYITEENAIICPTGPMEVAADGVFFRNDGKINTGNWYSVPAEGIAAAMEKAVALGRKKNDAGIKTALNLQWKPPAKKLVEIWREVAG